MVNFAHGELALPIRKILWAPSNAAHHNHLHVEGPHVSGTLANCTSKWTEAITTIRGALDGHFGLGDHYQVWNEDLAWTHMGVYNCRNIANTNTPSQHAFSNAIDIGPYYGVEEQQKFYDFLTRKKGEDEDMALTDEEIVKIRDAVYSQIASKVWGALVGPADNRRTLSKVLVDGEAMVRQIRTKINSGTVQTEVSLSADNVQAIVDAIVDEGIGDVVADELAARLQA